MAQAPASSVVRVRQAARLRGRIELPGDKSITHRALLLAALADGESRVLGGSDGLDCNSTAACIAALGANVERGSVGGDGRVDRVVRSPGADGLRQPVEVLDCGNSGTTLRMLAGIIAGLPMRAVLDGDASLRRRPVARIIDPLRSMGAVLQARDGDSVPPLTVVGRRPLASIDYTTSVPSAQVKSAILLAALAAEGTTTVRERVVTRDHTERMLKQRGVTVRRALGPDGASVEMEGPARVKPLDAYIPGDVSAAAFWLVAGAAHPDAELTIPQVGVNPTRRAVIDLLRRMGAQIEERASSGGAAHDDRDDGTGLDRAAREAVEPVADLTVRSSALRGIEVSASETARAIDEIPALCVAAACAEGRTVIRGAGELRQKESDRIAGIVEALGALGGSVRAAGEDIEITGAANRPSFGLRGAEVATNADHRLAMAFAIAGLIARGQVVVRDASSAAVSDPAFFTNLDAVRA
jgi:3-phosphoshikimate 1-carboxyvinyltransferase